MIKNFVKVLAAGAALLGASTMAAQANNNVFPSTMQPGETVGAARGAPLPEGVYLIDTISWGSRKDPALTGSGEKTHFLVNIPLIIWSTPWTIFGGNFQILGALPHATVSPTPGIDGGDLEGLYNPVLGAGIAWDLGGGFGFSYTGFVYFNAGDKFVSVQTTTLRNDFALSYTNDGWNLTANVIWGITFDSDKTCTAGCNGKTANGIGVDLTATKTFGKWEVGAVGFYARSYDEPNGGLGSVKQERFAVGPLVGYNFGPVILQAWVTREVYAKNASISHLNDAKETRAWGRIIIPIVPEAAAAPLVTKY